MSKSYDLWGGAHSNGQPVRTMNENGFTPNGNEPYAKAENGNTGAASVVVATEPNEGGEKKSGTAAEDRGNWGNKAEFILSCIGLSVGLGNVWRFPYLAYENGGAAFLIAYLILQLLVGKPLYLMELAMAQYSNLGPTKVWALNPAAKGVGISMCCISLIVCIYYNVIMAYTLFYFFSSMQATLPWTVCDESWADCVSERRRIPPTCDVNSTMMKVENWTVCECTGNKTIDDVVNVLGFNCSKPVKGSTELFFYKEAIQVSDGIDNMGAPLYKLALCLLLSWIIVVLCLIKGIKSSGKVVYFTATFPYVILLILLVRGSLLEGAIDGVKFFIIPKWHMLADIKVWVAAAGQMFFSLSVSFGGIIMFGSYNKFKNNIYGDALLISFMDLITSVIAGFVVFTTFGGMAFTLGTTVEKVAKSGYGLAFIAYPEALSNLPPPQLWSVLFFFMLFTLGLDSQFGMMETVLTCLYDEFPKLRRFKEPICVGLAIVLYFVALPCVCPGGDYVVTLLDHYGADFSVLILSCIETISVMWGYGVMNFVGDLEYMLGAKPHGWPYWVFCWVFASPVLIALLFLYRMVKYSPPIPFPQFAQGIGWGLCTFVLCPIPLWFVFHMIRTYRQNRNLSMLQLIKKAFEPTKDWRPADGSDRYAARTQNQDLGMHKVGRDNPGLDLSSEYH